VVFEKGDLTDEMMVFGRFTCNNPKIFEKGCSGPEKFLTSEPRGTRPRLRIADVPPLTSAMSPREIYKKEVMEPQQTPTCIYKRLIKKEAFIGNGAFGACVRASAEAQGANMCMHIRIYIWIYRCIYICIYLHTYVCI